MVEELMSSLLLVVEARVKAELKRFRQEINSYLSKEYVAILFLILMMLIVNNLETTDTKEIE